MQSSFWTVLAALMAGQAPGPQAGVSLLSERAEVDTNAVPAELVLHLRAENHLPVAVSELDIGVLYAATQQELAKARPEALYGRPDEVAYASGTVGVVRRRIKTQVQSNSDARLEIRAALPPGTPLPQAIGVHILGYSTVSLDAALLFAALRTHAAADEVAAVGALALTSGPTEKLAARARLASQADLVADIAARALDPVWGEPSQSDALERVYAVRALGVLSGERARQALRALRDRAELTRFDTAVQGLAVARLVGSPLTTPVAFAVPAEADGMAAVVEAALADAKLGEEHGPQEQEPGAIPRSPSPGGFFDVRTIAVSGAFFLAASAGGLWLWRRSRRR